MELVLLVGYPRAGKSTVREILTENHGFDEFVMGDVVRMIADDVVNADDSLDVVSEYVDIGELSEEEKEVVSLSEGFSESELSDFVTVILDYNDDFVLEYAVDELQSNSVSERVVVDSVRQVKGVRKFREIADDTVVTYVKASFEKRAERLKEDERFSEDENPRESLRERDENEDEWGTNDIINGGFVDAEIVNEDVELEELEHRVRAFVKDFF